MSSRYWYSSCVEDAFWPFAEVPFVIIGPFAETSVAKDAIVVLEVDADRVAKMLGRRVEGHCNLRS